MLLSVYLPIREESRVSGSKAELAKAWGEAGDLGLAEKLMDETCRLPPSLGSEQRRGGTSALLRDLPSYSSRQPVEEEEEEEA